MPRYGFNKNDKFEGIEDKGEALEERTRGAEQSRHSEFGLCAKCRHFRVIVHQKAAYTFKRAWCDELPAQQDRLTSDAPVKDCGLFWPVGAPTLREMMAEARAIEGRDLVKGYL